MHLHAGCCGMARAQSDTGAARVVTPGNQLALDQKPFFDANEEHLRRLVRPLLSSRNISRCADSRLLCRVQSKTTFGPGGCLEESQGYFSEEKKNPGTPQNP